ncbi:MAG: hypothetical protein ACRD0U_06090, partial [Acidimicrobiales bacterium]
MIVALLLGGFVGLGALMSYRLLFPPAPPLQAAVERLHRRNQLVRIATPDTHEDVSGLLGRTVGASVGRFLQALGLRLESLEPDLRLVGRTLEQHLGQKVLLGLFGFALPALLGLGWTLVGVQVSLT